jgi:hypothetical protein
MIILTFLVVAFFICALIYPAILAWGVVIYGAIMLATLIAFFSKISPLSRLFMVGSVAGGIYGGLFIAGVAHNIFPMQAVAIVYVVLNFIDGVNDLSKN